MIHMLYVTPQEIKETSPDLIQAATTRYNDPLYRLCISVSRMIDKHCRRVFYPELATRYFAGNGKTGLWVPDLLEASTISVSEDDGESYTDLTTDDWLGSVSGDFNLPQSWNRIELNVNGDWTTWPKGQRSVKITGIWGYADDRDGAWESSGLTLYEDAAIGDTSVDVTDVTLNDEDQYGLGTVLTLGRLIRINDEYLFVTSTETPRTVHVLRPESGTTEAAHTTGDDVEIWRPPFDITDAALIMAVQHLIRAQQGFFDVREGDAFGGSVRWTGGIDPEVRDRLSGYVRLGVG